MRPRDHIAYLSKNSNNAYQISIAVSKSTYLDNYQKYILKKKIYQFIFTYLYGKNQAPIVVLVFVGRLFSIFNPQPPTPPHTTTHTLCGHTLFNHVVIEI